MKTLFLVFAFFSLSTTVKTDKATAIEYVIGQFQFCVNTDGYYYIRYQGVLHPCYFISSAAKAFDCDSTDRDIYIEGDKVIESFYLKEEKLKAIKRDTTKL